jgi:hypothetical protein
LGGSVTGYRSVLGWLGSAVIATMRDLITFDPGRNGFAESSR